MKLHALEIPDDPAQLASWLEGHLLGLDLDQLIAELSVWQGAEEQPAPSLNELLGEHIPDILYQGLGTLPKTQLRLLLKHPRFLGELQRLVLDEGGDYWTGIPASPEISANSAAIRRHLEQHLAGRSEESARYARRAVTPKERPPPRPILSKSWLWAGTGWLAAAASILVAVFLIGDQSSHFEKRLAQQTALVDVLHAELRKQQALAQVRVEPADLPAEEEPIQRAALDPVDLPRNDPTDLPETALIGE